MMSGPKRSWLFPPPADSREEFASGWTGVIRRRWRVGAAVFVILTTISAALVFLVRPVWRAEASLRIGAAPALGGVSPVQAGSPSGLFSLFQQMTGDPFANELELLGSRTVVENVVRDNALDARLVAPRGWQRDSLFAYLRSTGEAGEAKYRLEWLPSGSVRVTRTEPRQVTIGEFAPGADVEFGGLRMSFLPRRPGPESVELRTIPFGEAVRQTTGKLAAERKRREANLVRIAYASPDPGLALAVVNSASEHYMALRMELQRRESGQTTDSLRVVAEQTLNELRREEVALEGFQREAGMIAPEAQSDAFVERHSEIVAALERARMELARTDEVLSRLSAATDPSAAWAGLVAHPTFLENQTLGDILTQLIGLEQRRIALSGRRTAEDDSVRAIEQQILFLDSSMRWLLSQYRDGVADGIRLLEAQRAELEAVLRQVPSDAIELQRRQRTLRQLSEVYLFTDQRLRQEALRNALSFASVQVVDPPALLFKPVWPRKKLGLALGILLGTGFGLLAMAVVERADRSIRGFHDAREVTGAPVLAMLPAAGEQTGPRSPREVVFRRNGSTPVRLLLAGVDGSGAAELAARALRNGGLPGATDVPVGGGPNGRGSGDRSSTRSGPPAPPAVAMPGIAPGLRAIDPSSALASGPLSTDIGAEAGGGDNGTLGSDLASPPEIQLGPTIDSYAKALLAADAARDDTEVVLVVRDGVTRREDAARASLLLREAGADPAGVIVVLDDRDAPDRV